MATLVSLPVTAATTATSTTSASSLLGNAVASAANNTEIASDFTTFLKLLTTQLQNQDPLSPMDTNQFTQQLVQFAGVEQQMKTNDSLSSLVLLQQASQTTEALSLVGTTVVVNGSGAALANNQASWTLNSTQPATVNITITNSAGQTVYTGTTTMSSGSQPFVWNGVGNDGTVWPAGNYTLTATGTTASGLSTAITTTVQGKVTAIDLTKSPALLTVNGQTYQLTDIQQIVAPSS